MATSQNDDDSTTVSETTTTRIDENTDEMPPPPPPPPPPNIYSQGERVVAFHQNNPYVAKLLESEYRNNRWEHYVHYTGWNKNWDEWVGEDRLMKYDGKNIVPTPHIIKTPEEPKIVQVSDTKPKTTNVPKIKKRKNDSLNKDEDTLVSEKLVNIQIPPTLKKQLVADSEFITHLGKLVKLPRRPNVEEILTKYREYRLKKAGSIIDESVQEILEGLRCYFDKALPAMLLYESERTQYADTIKDDVTPSTVYGAEHLLRLFVKLPELLVHANIEEDTITELQQNFVDFLK
ncbi:hypothetical protein ACFE04_007675 [Oxalis oulophora]